MIEIGVSNTITSPQVSNKDLGYINLAMKIAAASTHEMRHGAVIVKAGSVISVGINKQKNHPDTLGDSGEDVIRRNITTHAEIDALSRIKGNTKGAIIYVARVNKKNQAMFSRPCDNCYKSLKRAGFKKIVFTEGIGYEKI